MWNSHAVLTDVVFVSRHCRAQFIRPSRNSQSHSADAKEAMTLLSLLARLQQKRRRLEDVTGGSDNDVSSGVQLTKRQRQCYWSVVTCY
ncbi:hypothetical protein BaRGS_00030854 [Batillaria attramentaria]|uniref:Uncharacterized protein n=1 Tax=Batillaria attramentaria TaxID=370345 RepID=A0ABD0JTD8_9CAEN